PPPPTPPYPLSLHDALPICLLFGLCQSLTAVMTCAVYLFVCLKSWGGAFDVGLVTRYVGSSTQLFGGISLLLLTPSQVRVNGTLDRKSTRLNSSHVSISYAV